VYTIIAREGEVLSDPKALAVTLRLKAGSIHKLGTKPDSYQRIDFNAYDLRLYLKTGLREKKSEEKNPADMTLGELMQAIRILESRKKDVKAQWVKVHEKFSVPFACLTFAVIAVPLGVQSRGARKSKSRGLSWSIGVLLLYYLLTNAGNSLSERGVVPVEMGMWAPNFLFLSLGIYLLVKAARESPVLFLVWIQKAIERLRLARERKGGPEG
jgi:lipopolysaccharide export system permease protein